MIQPHVQEASPRIEARRADLVTVAIRAIARYGPAVSMEQMAAEAGITKPILYRHFGSRTGLVAAVSRRYLAELRPKLAAVDDALPLRERTRRQFEVGLAYLEQRPGLLLFIDREQGFAASADRDGQHAEALVALMRLLIAAKGLDPRLARPLAHGIGGFILRSTVAWVHDREAEPSKALPLESMAHAITDLIFDGVEGLLGRQGERGGPAHR